MHFLIQTKSWSSAWNRLSTVSKLNQVISQRVLSGQEFMAMDSNREHHFTSTPSISLFAQCEIEEKIDGLFKKLSDGGEVLMPLDKYPFSEKFGWLRTNLACPGN
jgi:predicted 3-demethylubiquinone-9 3-methyltransferase (glyoxalase superfamily)